MLRTVGKKAGQTDINPTELLTTGEKSPKLSLPDSIGLGVLQGNRKIIGNISSEFSLKISIIRWATFC
jgi:hypothetical protein